MGRTMSSREFNQNPSEAKRAADEADTAPNAPECHEK